MRRGHLSLFLHTGDEVVTWPESPALVGPRVASFDIEGPPCVVEGPGDQYELPSWTCTPPHPSRHLYHRTEDIAVTWPESAVVVGFLVASFHVEGSLCVLRGPSDQYELPSWTYTAPRTARHLSRRTRDRCLTWPESPVLAGSLVVSYDTDGSPCVLKGPCDQYESPSWACTAPSTARHLFLRNQDAHVTWPESPALVGSLVASFDIEGSPCVLK